MEIELQDGTVLDAPDGLSPDQVKTLVQNYSLKNPGVVTRAQAAGVTPQSDLPFGRRFEQGVQDIGLGAMQLGAHVAPFFAPPPPPGMTEFPADANPAIPGGLQQPMDQAVQANQAAYTKEREAAGGRGMDIPRLLGNATATLPLALMTPVPETLPAAMGAGALGGATMAALEPVTDSSKSFAAQKLLQMGAGGAVGAPAGLVGGLVSKAVSPTVSDSAKLLLDKGVSLTPGQRIGPVTAKMEDRLTGIPGLGNAIAGAQERGLDSFQRAVQDDVLAPIGVKSPDTIGYDGADAVHKIISSKYDELLPKLTFHADDQLLNDLGNLSLMASEMPEEQAKRFQDIVTKKVFSRLSKTDMMDGQTWKGVESELNTIKSGLLKDPSFDQRELGAAINEVLASLRDSLERSNPQYAGELSKLNDSYSRLATLENATARIGTDDGRFTPSQFLGAVRNSDRSIRKNKFARGEAQMQDLARAGKKVLGAKYPDSGTVGRSIPAAMLLSGAGIASLGKTAAGLGLASLPYIRPGQMFMSALMAPRPAMRPVANLINRALLPAGGIGAAAYDLGNP